MAYSVTRAQVSKEKERLLSGKAPSPGTALRMTEALLQLLPEDPPKVAPYKRVGRVEDPAAAPTVLVPQPDDKPEDDKAPKGKNKNKAKAKPAED